MSDILIRGMEMPETCASCEWSYYVGNGRAMCKKVSMRDKTEIMAKRKADFCPLVEVPTPHGRLIDADALKEEGADIHMDYVCDGYVEDTTWGYSDDLLDSQPTIIEAEE